ncbi:M48 family metallopeptidase [Pontibacter sp. G13]|uniref:M48 family metallopeptidase n=1 Tax=Pontibacter sp. G13 TaxID=3074898 RepID=UPI002889A843|nr:M48 family metallopeptidase [Pontibacter sp. G13]WNJ18887.1 M48 family metallopeptidase [Pontibacter sp. G13]
MKNLINYSLIALMAGLFACSKVPITGRTQLNLVSSTEMAKMSAESYKAVLDSSALSTNAQQVALVRKVGNKISKAVESYMRDHGMEDQVSAFQWEFNLIESEQVNAWAMPGGKVAFYTGILPICKDEEGVAVVMSHEVAHVIARHGNERMSQALITQLGAATLSESMKEKPETTQAIWMGVFGAGAQLGVMLPFSRKHESEADEMGLHFMAIAGYDPNESVGFWERMQAAAGGGAPPEVLSTHPSSATRIENLKRLAPGIKAQYAQ